MATINLPSVEAAAPPPEPVWPPVTPVPPVVLDRHWYAASTLGFYLDSIHGADIPADAVEISAAEHKALLDGQTAGQMIVPDENGYPVLVAPPPYEPPPLVGD